VRELEKAKPDKWGCVQARELWSPQEERQVRPGNFWLLKFGKVPGNNSCIEKKFKLDTRKYEQYKGVRSEAPVAMIVNSSELRAAGFDLREVIPFNVAPTRGGGAWRTAEYARRGPQADSRHGYQEVCTLRG
jgi:hypothetical protein